MAKLSILAGATSQSVNIFIQDSSVTTGAGLTGLVFNTSSLTAYYTFTGANATATVISLVTLAAVNSAFSSGGFKEISSANMPGLYRLDIPNAALAGSSGRAVTILLKGATNMVPCVLEIELTAIDNQSTAFGLSIAKTTNITGFNDIAASAIVSSGAITTSGGAVSTVTTTTNLTNAATAGDFTSTMKTSLNNSTPASITGAVASVTGNVGGNVVGSVASVTARVTANTDQLAGQTVTAAAGVTFPTSVASPTNITAGTITTVTNLTNAPTSGDFTATMKTSLNSSTPTSVTTVIGNVNGSVGSVTSAVTVDGTSPLTESYAAQGAALTLSQAMYGMNQLMSQQSIAGTTLTTKKRNGSTVAKTYTLNDATSPTAISEAT